jgi:hypothetical protein
MSDIGLQPTQPVGFSAAFRALKQCETLLRAKLPNYHKVLELLEPFRHCNGFPDVTSDESNVVMSLLCATFGDCYRELGDVETAAKWYRQAGTYSEGTGFAEIYGAMVVAHGLRDHYQPALCSLRASKERDRKTSLLSWAYYNLVSMWKCWPSWRMSRQTNRLIETLTELLGSPACKP